MPASIRLLPVLATIAFCLPATATETAPPEVQPEVQPAPAATAAPAAATAAPAAPTTQAAKPATRVPSGYKSKVVDGETFLCRKSTPLGSRFPTEVCMTAAQYEESVRQQDGLRQELTGKQKSYSISQ